METYTFSSSMLWKVRLSQGGRGGVVGSVRGKCPLTSEQLLNSLIFKHWRECGQGQVIRPCPASGRFNKRNQFCPIVLF